MKALIEYLARALAEHPEDVRVEEVHQGRRVSFHLYVNEIRVALSAAKVDVHMH